MQAEVRADKAALRRRCVTFEWNPGLREDILDAMKTSWWIIAAALLLGAAGGYLVGASGEPGENGKAQPTAASSKSTRARPRLVTDSFSSTPRRGTRFSSLENVFAEPGQTNRIMNLLEYYSELDPSEFEGEMQKLQALPMSQRMLAMNLLFARWAETDPETALEQSRTMGFPEVFMARAGVISGWAASNPEGLARAYSENADDFRANGPGRRGVSDTVAVIAGEWAKQNPQAALAWARTLERGEVGNAISGIFTEVTQSDPAVAISMASGLTSEERGNAFRSIAGAWAITDYPAAAAWIDSLTGAEKTAARQEALESLANINPQKAAAEVLQLPGSPSRDRLVGEVSREWAQKDAAAALDWLTANGEGAVLEESIGRVIGPLAAKDAGKALEWIDTQPAGEARDNAVQGFIWGNRNAEPLENIRLAETISGEETRQQIVTCVTFEWARDEPAAALQYAQSSEYLGDGVRKRLIDMMERDVYGSDSRDSGVGRGPRGR